MPKPAYDAKITLADGSHVRVSTFHTAFGDVEVVMRPGPPVTPREARTIAVMLNMAADAAEKKL